ncbi:cobalt-zinc-cadmium resistance protein CzcA [Klebsiella pneumoniae]|uniref:Cobalt-zinc-cadmium resistance protein CzcA n=1 Tax=Klebsiella pneumoniae TaxID=573 RepID=A0A378BI25_KLEPN|nr:cobalt-zinc-cadmium resistance protein CzcA [Klebsiella pneumoniae]
MGALLAGAIWGFTFVRQNFFPSSNTPIFFVDLWLPYGTDINATEKMTRDIERSIAGQPGVVTTVSTIGQGSMRFILTTAGSASTATTRRLWCGWMINAASPLSPATWRTGLPETTRRLTPAPNALCSGPPGIARLRCALRAQTRIRCARWASQIGDILAADPATDSVRNDWQNRSQSDPPASIPRRWDASWGWINRILITRWR